MSNGSKIALPLLISLTAIGFVHSSWAVEEVGHSESAFKGKISLSAKESTPDWPQPVKAPKGAPNIIVILLDDIGFADTSTFGGIAQTPELDKLAAQGLRYNNFHTTAMCSPTRAALLTGRNHHRVGFGIITDGAAGYPGYNSVWKESTASMAEVLRQYGYSTAAFGKWHNTPLWEISSIGPFDRWPTGRGFEYFYGFMNAEDNQWEPTILYRNTLPVDAPATAAQGYHLTTDMTNEAIRWVAVHTSLAPEKPYFLYFATGAVHHPHHAPREWIDRYRGQFDQGWDRLREKMFQRQKQLGVIPKNAQLTGRPQEIPAWNSLSADQRKLYARQMEVYAGFIGHTDHEIGRLLKTVRSSPGGENTLVVYIVGDNGAAAHGLDGWTRGAATVQEQLQHFDELGSVKIPENSYSMGWAWTSNTPFQYWKTVASHFGGVRDPMIVSWPAKIKNTGELRGQFTHVTDVAATLYDVIGISLPDNVNGVAQQPLDGVSFAPSFGNATATSAHRTQYFELVGNRAIYHEGWVAAARHVDADFSKDRWELYHVSEDFSQARDLAKHHPKKLRELQDLFDKEARENDVYPLGAVVWGADMPSLNKGRRQFVYLPSESRISVADIPPFGIASYRVSADVDIPEAGAQGVLISYGDRAGGFTWYLKEDLVIYESKAGNHHDMLTSSIRIPRGQVELAYEFKRDEKAQHDGYASGKGLLYINGRLAGEKELTFVRNLPGDMSLYIGRAAGSPVSDAYMQPFKFTGTLQKVTVDLQ